MLSSYFINLSLTTSLETLYYGTIQRWKNNFLCFLEKNYSKTIHYNEINEK